MRPPRQTIQLRGIRSAFVGGEILRLEGLPIRQLPTIRGAPPRQIDPNGAYAVGQLYLQSFQLSRPDGPFPVQLWHGGGLSGACWETTPDGRPGWLNFFLRRGFDVTVVDAPERGRASWAPYPEINAEAPWHRTLEMAWWMFRFGPPGGYHPDPALRQAFAGLQFPVEAAEIFLKQFVARWGSRQSDAWAICAYDALLAQSAPAIVIAHSQGGLYALDLAVRRPDAFKALVLLEPVLPPEADYPFQGLAGTPILLVNGDNFQRETAFKRFADALRQAGGQVDLLDLPGEGVFGNSHMLMMDRNSDEVAGRVALWLSGQL
ncbi:hypothetical protein ACO2Q3_01230 [Caulobacter sp. KR2-114]|uniref:hypothetical protein n=1 Tax=Caulobacter sp. KR2-114 TaxID=3400912 RepID=UPI003C06AFF8